ncbi:hypothetical protein B0H16DRAFT_1614654 [Mycena metata]|uniref:Uncharacterized protein n=1 Tax=Mycena metata TaxID=1033252 RepID=A0AAD7HB25_9AGAR|nr:hypothetical protein B0H16DRAFT_1614654 [Mycena metata]
MFHRRLSVLHIFSQVEPILVLALPRRYRANKHPPAHKRRCTSHIGVAIPAENTVWVGPARIHSSYRSVQEFQKY